MAKLTEEETNHVTANVKILTINPTPAMFQSAIRYAEQFKESLSMDPALWRPWYEYEDHIRRY